MLKTVIPCAYPSSRDKLVIVHQTNLSTIQVQIKQYNSASSVVISKESVEWLIKDLQAFIQSLKE